MIEQYISHALVLDENAYMMYPTVRPQIIPTMVAIGMAAAGCPRETWYEGNAAKSTCECECMQK